MAYEPEEGATITEATANMLKPAIERAIKERLSQAAFAAELARLVFSKDRAAQIADYETKSTFHQATLEAFRQSGKIAAVRWVTIGDDLIEEICEENENEGRSSSARSSRRAIPHPRRTRTAGAGWKRPY